MLAHASATVRYLPRLDHALRPKTGESAITLIAGISHETCAADNPPRKQIYLHKSHNSKRRWEMQTPHNERHAQERLHKTFTTERTLHRSGKLWRGGRHTIAGPLTAKHLVPQLAQGKVLPRQGSPIPRISTGGGEAEGGLQRARALVASGDRVPQPPGL